MAHLIAARCFGEGPIQYTDGRTASAVTGESEPLTHASSSAAASAAIPDGFTAKDVSNFMRLHESEAEALLYPPNANLHTLYGAHEIEESGVVKSRFLTFAPNADAVHLALLNDDDTIKEELPLTRGPYGNWSLLTEQLDEGTRYAFNIHAEFNLKIPNSSGGYDRVTETGWKLRLDPFAVEKPAPRSLGALYQPKRTAFDWGHAHDSTVSALRKQQADKTRALNIFEMQPGSFSKKGMTQAQDFADAKAIEPEGTYGDYLNWRELAPKVIAHCKEAGFTTVLLNGFLEYPDHASGGYQPTSFFTPTSRLGSLEDCKGFIKALHEAGITVHIDFIPHHFAIDQGHLLSYDGTTLFDDEYHPQWGAFTTDLAKPAVRDFLLSSAKYFVDELKIDGIRVDAAKQIIHERPSGRAFLRAFNTEMHKADPHILTVAEDASSAPETTTPVGALTGEKAAGLGFDYSWGMWLANQVLDELCVEPKHSRNMGSVADVIYRTATNAFIPVFSHDEMWTGSGALVSKLRKKFPGLDDDSLLRSKAQARNVHALNLLLNGTTTTFMGAEIQSMKEWQPGKRVGYESYLSPTPSGGETYETKAFRMFATLSKLVQGHPTLAGRNTPSSFRFALVDEATKTLSFLRTRSGFNPILVTQSWDPEFDPKRKTGRNVSLSLNAELRALAGTVCRARELFNSDDLLFGGTGVRSTSVSFDGENVEFCLKQMSTTVIELDDTAPLTRAVPARRASSYDLFSLPSPVVVAKTRAEYEAFYNELSTYVASKHFESLSPSLQDHLKALTHTVFGPESECDDSELLSLKTTSGASVIDLMRAFYKSKATTNTSLCLAVTLPREQLISLADALLEKKEAFDALSTALLSGDKRGAARIAQTLPEEFKALCTDLLVKKAHFAHRSDAEKLSLLDVEFLIQDGFTPGRGGPFITLLNSLQTLCRGRLEARR